MKLFGLFGKKKADKYANPIDHTFGLSADEAREKYAALQERLSRTCGIPVRYEYVDGVCTGGCARDKYPAPSEVDIVCPELCPADRAIDSDVVGRNIAGKDVVKQVVAFCHETEHIRQYARGHDANGDSYYAMRYLVDMRNPVFYDAGGSRYWNNGTEIPAEQAGIRDAAGELHAMFPDVPEETCRDAVLEYVRDRCFPPDVAGNKNFADGRSDYFIRPESRDGMTLDGARQLFREKEAANHVPNYRRLNEVFSKMPDEFCRTVYISDGRSPWWTVVERMDAAKTERETIEIMYAVMLMNHPEDLKNYASIRKDAGRLQPDRMFGDGFLARVTEYDRRRGANPPYLSNPALYRELPVLEGEPSYAGLEFD